jgi:hypothetical protein
MPSSRRCPAARQRPGEAKHLVEFCLIAPLAPALVVEILAPPRGIGADRLDVAVRVWADPDVDPGRWDDELADALEDLGIRDAVPFLVDVLEAPSPSPADDSRTGAVGASQSGHDRVFPHGPTSEPPPRR